jgi:hypothetical protein
LIQARNFDFAPVDPQAIVDNKAPPALDRSLGRRSRIWAQDRGAVAFHCQKACAMKPPSLAAGGTRMLAAVPRQRV